MSKLYPIPSLPPSRLSPRPWPGITPGSTEKVLATLQDNHERWHCFYNKKGFHNHISHWILAIWSLGGRESQIEEAYRQDSSYQVPAFASPEAITAANFWDHIGDDKYYAAYFEFFRSELETEGIARTLEEYIFAPEANYRPDREEEKQPRMVDRLFAGLIHPFIYVGYGCEFGLPGLICEGLGHATSHPTDLKHVLSRDFLTTRSGLTLLENQLESKLSLNENGPARNTHAFTVLGRMLKDTRFDHVAPPNHIDELPHVPSKIFGEAIKEYAAQWSFDTFRPGEVERKIEELSWVNTMIYGIGGWTPGKPLVADFYLMHLVTSSLFLPSVAAYLSPAVAEVALRSYFTASLMWWVSMGRPHLNIREFFSAEIEYPAPSGALPTPHSKSLPSEGSHYAVNPNPWLPIIETAIVHPEDHLPKIQRALSHHGQLYGSRKAGLPDFAQTELEGAEVLDGTLFIRVAELTATRMGRIREGEELGKTWERTGWWHA